MEIVHACRGGSRVFVEGPGFDLRFSGLCTQFK